jgi:hypothetical protein
MAGLLACGSSAFWLGLPGFPVAWLSLLSTYSYGHSCGIEGTCLLDEV